MQRCLTNRWLEAGKNLFQAGLLCAATLAASGAATVVENEQVTAQYSNGKVSLYARGSSDAFLVSASLLSEGGAASVVEITNTIFGVGRAIQVTYPAGETLQVALYPRLPFALFHSTVHNQSGARVTRDRIRVLSAEVSVGHGVDGVTTFGTGGLLPFDRNPGSYAWLAAVEPRSRNGVVLGWLSHDRGSGVIFSSIESGKPQVEAVVEYGKLRVAPGQSTSLETLAVGYFADARLGLESWAEAVARYYRVQLKPQPTGYCTWYSKPYGGAADESHLVELAGFSATNLAPFGFSVVQIDDGWQAGFKRKDPSSPKKDFRTHNPRGPYPAGMKATADRIKSLGLVPGIWFMPFAGTVGDPFFDQHLDWFARTPEGQPYDTPWGGTCRDMTHPGAREHLRSTVARICREWGFDYIKIDGLWTGTATKQLYVNSGYKADDLGQAVRHDPESTAIQSYRSGLKLVREAAGDKVFILGCNSPQNMRTYGGTFGLVDAMRIGPDNKADWKSLLRGPTFGTRHYFLHRRVWYNDPDPVYVRDSIPLNHAQLICSWVAMSGQLNLSSEWIPGLSAERLDVLRRTMPSHQENARPVDLFDQDLPSIWTATARGRTVVGLFNWQSQAQKFDLPLERLGLDAKAEYAGFDYWGERLIPSIRGRLEASVPAESCLMLVLRTEVGHPQVLSSSRHVMQGLVDVSGEVWDTAAGTVSAQAALVGGFPTELRITGAGPGATVELSEPDRAAGVRATIRQSGGLTRVELASASSRQVRWKLKVR